MNRGSRISSTLQPPPPKLAMSPQPVPTLPVSDAPTAGRLKLRVVCAWCQSVQAEGEAGAATSHTICESCAADFFPNCGERVLNQEPQR